MGEVVHGNFNDRVNDAPPRIVCAANQLSYIDLCGKVRLSVVTGARHMDLTMRTAICALIGVSPDGNKYTSTELESNPSLLSMDQGFIDQYGTFYDRKAAWVIADINNQIYRRCGGDGPDGRGLFSENLY